MNTETWLLAALLAGVSVPAHADTYLNCNDFHQTLGYAGANPPLTARVTHLDYGRWTVTYYLRDGQVVFRENQFGMSDKTDSTKTEWSGWRGNKLMRGMLRNDNATGHIIYKEYLYDGNNQLLSSNWIDCGANTSAPPPQKPPTYEAPVPPDQQYNAPMPPKPMHDAPPTTTATSNGLTIPLKSDGLGGHTIDVTLGTSTSATMLLDTGATIVSIPQDIVAQLISIGEAVVITQGHFTFADGTTSSKNIIDIGKFTIGGKTIYHVRASVNPVGTPLLLGTNVLNRFGKYSIESTNHQLILG